MGIDQIDEVDISTPKADLLAKAEVEKFSGDKRRSEEKKEVIHRACMVMISVIGVLITSIIAIRLYHLVMPIGACWLNDERIQALDKFFFSGTIGALLTSFLKRSFSSKEE